MADDIAAAPTAGEDERRLHELGYAQELHRRMSGFSNFAVSFTIISILSGCLTLYGYGMNTGGPAIIVWGWPIVGIMTLMVGLAMAEVCSSFPTAGGLYYWSAKLARKNGPAWSWFTGWFNFLGQVAVTAGIDFGCAFFINALLNLIWGVSTAHWVTILIFAVVLFVHGVMNQFGIKLVALLNDISVWWHILGVLIIVAVLAFVPSKHASASYVFTNIVNNTGWSSTFYVLLLGLLLAQYTLHRVRRVGAHDRGDARRRAQRPARHRDVDRGLADRRLGAADRRHVRDPERRTTRVYTSALVPPAQVWVTAIGDTGAKLLLLVVIGAQLFCGMSSVTANSRMIYAFSRDGALPGSNYLAPGEQADQDADQRDLAGRGRGADPGPAVPVEQRGLRRGHLDRGHRPVHRLRDTRRSCGCGRARASSAGPGTWAGGATWSAGSRSSGWSSSRSCSCCPPRARSAGSTSTTPSWP